jgi:hypothetical protein
MTNQLLLIDSRPAWRLDRATRAQGLEGVANARAVLRAVDAKRAAELEADEAAVSLADVKPTATDGAEQTSLPLADAA